jgi:hypothetical protein
MLKIVLSALKIVVSMLKIVTSMLKIILSMLKMVLRRSFWVHNLLEYGATTLGASASPPATKRARRPRSISRLEAGAPSAGAVFLTTSMISMISLLKILRPFAPLR